MVSFPPCKINLGLNIISKRPDGFHDIETCFYPVPWNDILEIIPSSVFSFNVTGTTIPGRESENLCVKAYSLIEKEFAVSPVQMHLHKIIPTGAGLGGGSSDAAHTLRSLNNVFDLKIKSERLQQYAAALGSDCTFFIQDKPKLGTGRGEILQDINAYLKDKHLVIIKPDIHVSTAEAYAGVLPQKPEIDLREIIEKQPVKAWRSMLKNDFEITVFKKFPDIKRVKDKLYDFGAHYASMSGSGSTVFGIFPSFVDLKSNFPGTAYWGGNLSL
jgi:4-diphosphocytidyl-2-C-methyl-D-erythritol kinase